MANYKKISAKVRWSTATATSGTRPPGLGPRTMPTYSTDHLADCGHFRAAVTNRSIAEVPRQSTCRG